MSSLYDVGRHKRTAWLWLIDHTTDLLTPCCRGDSLVDQIMFSVPRRTRSSFGQKGLQPQQRHRPTSLLQAPLDVQIPLADLLKEGWNSYDSATQLNTLVSLRNKLESENCSTLKSELLKGSLVST